jgi:hypothetical protein
MLLKVIKTLRCDGGACFVSHLIARGHCNLNNMFDLRRLRGMGYLRRLRMLNFEHPSWRIIEISSSSSYQLSLFSSKCGPIHLVGECAALGEQSSLSIGALWPEVNSIEGGLMAATRSSLETSSSRHLPDKEVKRETLIDSGA